MVEDKTIEAIRHFALGLEQAGHSKSEIAKGLVCFGLALGEQQHGPEAWLEILASASQRLAAETTKGTA